MKWLRVTSLGTFALTLFACSPEPESVTVRGLSQALVNGPVSFVAGRDISAGQVAGVSAMDARDLDGDGDVDIAVFEGGAHADGRVTFAWFESPSNPGAGTWTRREFTRPAVMRRFIGAAKFGDVDGDGDYDAVVAMDNHSNTTKSAYVYWLENPRPSASATSAWAVREIRANLAVHHINDMELADMDGDGKLDVVARSLDANQLHIFFQNSKTSWTAKAIDATPYGPTGEGFALGNIDAQGMPDITICGRWLRAPAAPRTQSYSAFAIDAQYCTVTQNTKEDVGDIDKDGLLDVVISPAEGYRSGGNHVLAWYRNPGNPSGSSSWQRTVLASNMNGGHTVKLADMDGDSDLDVVSGIAWDLWGQTKSIKVYYNFGSGVFGRVQTVATGKGLYSGVVRDLGADGDLDIIGPEYYSGSARPYFYESLESAASAPSPDFRTAIAIPSAFEAEAFYPDYYVDADDGNAGGMYRQDTDVDVYRVAGENYRIGRVMNGEEVSWYVEAASQGAFDVTFYVSNPSYPGRVSLGVDHKVVTGVVSVPMTGNWSNFQALVFNDLPIPAGKHWLTLYMQTSAGYVGDFDRVTISR